MAAPCEQRWTDSSSPRPDPPSVFLGQPPPRPLPIRDIRSPAARETRRMDAFRPLMADDGRAVDPRGPTVSECASMTDGLPNPSFPRRGNSPRRVVRQGVATTRHLPTPHCARGQGRNGLRRCWRAVCADAKLGRLRLHDLRHSLQFGSVTNHDPDIRTCQQELFKVIIDSRGGLPCLNREGANRSG